MHAVCCDRTLWASVDLRARHLPLEELQKYLRFLQPVTKLLALRGNKRKHEFPEMHPSILDTISLECYRLQDFLLEEYNISREKVVQDCLYIQYNLDFF